MQELGLNIGNISSSFGTETMLSFKERPLADRYDRLRETPLLQVLNTE